MEDQNKKSRRSIITMGLFKSKKQDLPKVQPGLERTTIKMLTPDGQLVEIEKTILENQVSKKKASNKEILDWSQKHIHKNL